MSEALLNYEQTGRYVFHGSAVAGITSLEPRQSYSFGKPDGDSAISATANPIPAVFMAFFGRKSGAAMGIHPAPDNIYGLTVPASLWQQAHTEKWNGWVYVLNRDDFTLREPNGTEWRSYKPVAVVDAIKVELEDMPLGITIIEDEKIKSYIDSFISGSL